MKPFRWNPEKNDALKRARGLSFESVVVAVESGGLLDIVNHPKQAKYPNQRVLVVAIENYAHLVPFAEEEDHYFLKTVIPSRKATRNHLHKGEPDVDT
jgi:uncharacterized DUF497 family protein